MNVRFDLYPEDGGDWTLEAQRVFLPPEQALARMRLFWLRRREPDPPEDLLHVTGLVTGIRAPHRDVERVTRELMPFSHGLSLPPAPGMEVLVQLSLGKEVRLAWGRGVHIWQAIHEAVEESERKGRPDLLYALAAAALVLRPQPRGHAVGLGPWLTAAVVYAMRFLAPLLLRSRDAAPPSPPLLSRKDIESRAEAAFQGLLQGEVEAIRRVTRDIHGPANTLRFLEALGQRLWQTRDPRGLHEAVRREIDPSRPPDLQPLTGLHAALLALFTSAAREEMRGKVWHLVLPARPEPVPVVLDEPWRSMGAWHQFLEALSWSREPPARYLTWLFAQGMDAAMPGPEHRSRFLVRGPAETHPAVPPRAFEDFARALLQRAREEKGHPPLGRFVVEVPEETGLPEWGIRGLAVAAVPDGLYVRLLTDAPGYAPVFFWRPSEAPPRVSPFLFVGEARALLDAALAALWHDLVVEPEDAFHTVPEGNEEGQRPSTGPAVPPLRPRRPSVARPQYFPRRRQTVYRGRLWGGEEKDGERRTVRMHFVTAHLRRLPPGHRASEEARRAADAYGVILPDGFTFVRPHLRGGNRQERAPRGEAHPEPEPPPRRARFRGLRSLAALMRGMRRG